MMLGHGGLHGRMGFCVTVGSVVGKQQSTAGAKLDTQKQTGAGAGGQMEAAFLQRRLPECAN